jgi:hypothetical protein
VSAPQHASITTSISAGGPAVTAQHLVRQGLLAEAERAFRETIALDPDSQIARRGLAELLVRLGRREESLFFFHAELVAGVQGLAWLQDLLSTAMQDQELWLAGEYAAVLAALRRGTTWYPPMSETNARLSLPVHAPTTYLTIPKLQHDVEQFLYLQRRGILGDEFTPVIRDYERIAERLTLSGANGRSPLEGEERDAIGHVYNRLVHVRHTPRVAQALSGTWDAAAVERRYIDETLGVVVIDDFLSAEALEALRLFCLESTVWSGNRYAHGRLGAFLRDGFNCPLPCKSPRSCAGRCLASSETSTRCASCGGSSMPPRCRPTRRSTPTSRR